MQKIQELAAGGKQDVWATPSERRLFGRRAIWAPALETLAIIIPASNLSKHYFSQSKYYLRSHQFHQ